MDSHFPCVLTSSGTLESLNLKRWNTVWYKHSEARKTVTVSPGTLFFFKDLRKKNNTTWADTQTVMWGFNSRFLFPFFFVQTLTDGLYSEGSLWLKYKSFGSSSQIGVWVKRRETEGRLGFHASSPTSHIRNAYPINFTTNELIYLIFMDFICKVQTYYFSAD